MLDHDQDILIKLRGERFKSYIEKFAPPIILAKQYLGNLRVNMGYFLAMDFQMKSGMKYLIDSFYRSIQTGAPVPIPYREILLTARIMDAIFAQLSQKQSVLSAESAIHGAVATPKLMTEPVLHANQRSATTGEL
jgi:hypothetical protein